MGEAAGRPPTLPTLLVGRESRGRRAGLAPRAPYALRAGRVQAPPPGGLPRTPSPGTGGRSRGQWEHPQAWPADWVLLLAPVPAPEALLLEHRFVSEACRGPLAAGLGGGTGSRGWAAPSGGCWQAEQKAGGFTEPLHLPAFVGETDLAGAGRGLAESAACKHA